LEELLRCLGEEREDLVLVMPATGRDCINVPAQTLVCELDEADRAITSKSVVLVSNANASHLYTLRLARRLRASGASCRTIAILHNYPKNKLRERILKVILKEFDQAIAVEPGLRALRGDAITPSWLATPQTEEVMISAGSLRQRTIKCYARPDRSKGLHILPAVFRQMSALGYVCEVALGESLENDRSYIKSLEASLAPWLVEGLRGPDWLNPGDIFVVPSIYGEAACLSAQEAMSKGVFVVASRVGLMPYLSPTNQGIRTFQAGSVPSAIAALTDVAAISAEEFDDECRAASSQIASRSGRWYREVTERLRREHREVGKTAS
jgi:glycosyltransferase involved in cell wall biosynthesis